MLWWMFEWLDRYLISGMYPPVAFGIVEPEYCRPSSDFDMQQESSPCWFSSQMRWSFVRPFTASSLS